MTPRARLTASPDMIRAARPLRQAAMQMRASDMTPRGPTLRMTYLWRACPDLRRVPGNSVDLTGTRLGRLVCVGLLPNKRGVTTTIKGDQPASWVVRCDCGNYTTRKAKSLTQPGGGKIMPGCSECEYRDALKRKDFLNRTGRYPTAAETARLCGYPT